MHRKDSIRMMRSTSKKMERRMEVELDSGGLVTGDLAGRSSIESRAWRQANRNT